MKKIFTAAALLATLTAGTANASSDFDFSYNFADGSIVTGSLSGDLNGALISNISDIQVNFNGTEFLGPLYLAGWNPDPAVLNWDSSPVVSTNEALNNFVFADTNFALDTSASNYFYFTNDSTYGAQVSAININVLTNNSSTDYINNGTWTITAVPVPAALPMMLSGLGIFAAVGRRRRQAA